MSELAEKVKISIERLKAFEPEDGYYLAFSGGKDSVVCKALMDMAGVKYDATYRVTSVDPPELVQFIRDKHPDVKREVPKDKDGKPITMWNLIPRKMYPPTRVARYCCQYLKENAGDGRMTVTGVRWAESNARKANQGIVTLMTRRNQAKDVEDHPDFRRTNRGGVILVNDNDNSRRMVEQCFKRHRTSVNPIIDWTDSDVWTFIRSENVPFCGLYEEGFTRLGCIGCPMVGTKTRERQFVRWPKYKGSYLRAFQKMLDVCAENGRPWRARNSPHDVFNCWMEYDILPGQMDLFAEDSDE